jgi:uncharacterized protein
MPPEKIAATAAFTLQSPRTDRTTMTALQAVPAQTPPLGTRSDRLGVLDVLRGIALLGMFLVHFNDYSSGGGGLAGVYQRIALLFFDERFWAIFGILFGVGFAIQLRRADARGERFVGKYLRRLLALAGFGFIAHGVFGFNVLLGYAIWGVPLLLVRKWSIRALVAAAILSAASGSVYQVARAAHGVATIGEPAFRAEQADLAARTQRFKEANAAAQDATSYSTVFAARLEHMRWFYVQWWTFLPVNTFTLFLLGVLGLRLGIFDRPDQHRRLIAGLMLLGAASWAASTWLLPAPPADLGTPLVRNLVVARLEGGFGLVRESWLAFTYIGAVLLLVARDPGWLRRLAAFGWAGRMALTNYMLQIAILDLAFAKYALGLSLTPLVGMMAALALFLANASLSRWWLERFRYGPLEWLWRCLTLWCWQPWRIPVSHSPASA